MCVSVCIRGRKRERMIGKNVSIFDDLVLSQSLKQCLFKNMLL